MALLLVLFLGRVIGQILVATTAPSWLPPMARWYSGLMPYRLLLPTQIVFVVVMTAMTIGVDRQSPPFGTLSADAGARVVWASYVYALGMVVRSIRYARATPERRGVLIPIVFHFVLAGFLFAYGSAEMERSDSITSRIGRTMPLAQLSMSSLPPSVSLQRRAWALGCSSHSRDHLETNGFLHDETAGDIIRAPVPCR